MSGGFPDYHSFPERDHGDDSFWPSFTDIMMVITMVFLLVTVMAITNNWKLVTDLKNSMNAQRLAAETALDKEAKNHTLEDQLLLLEQRLAESNKIASEKQAVNQDLQLELARIQAKIKEIEAALATSLAATEQRETLLEQREQQVTTLQASTEQQEAALKQSTQALSTLQITQDASEKRIALLQQQLSDLAADRDKQLATAGMRAEALSALQNIQETSQSQVVRLQEELKRVQGELAEVNQADKSSAVTIAELRRRLEVSEAALLASKQDKETSLAELELQLKALQTNLAESQQSKETSVTDLERRLQSLQASLDAMELEKTTAVSALEAQLQSSQDSLDESKALSESQISELKTEIERLTALSSSEDERVQSLKDEYDELDAKYKKLLRPARSSVGKQVVSVWFSKSGGRDVYRIRETENGEFKVTTRAQMSEQLARLKDEYGKTLYVKVIIPENSGLSYSDAWRFTTEMQRAYDYYYQDEE